MATITTAQSGPKSAGSTWVGGVPPADGVDRAVIAANHTLTVDVDWVVGDSPSDTTTNVLAIQNGSGGIVIPDGRKLEVRGNLSLGSARWEQGAAAVEFNSLNATTPTTNYQFKFSGGAATRVVITGQAGNPASFASRPGGGNFSFTSPAGDANNFNCKYVNFSRVGTASIDSFQIDGPTVASYVQVFENCTWDGCGRFRWLYNPNQASGYSFADCTWKNGLATFLVVVGGGTRPAAARRFLRCTFDGQVQIQGNGTEYDACYFHNGWVMNSGAQNWKAFKNCFVRLSINGGYNQWGDIEDCYFLSDPWEGQSPLASGTATGGGDRALVNTGAGWVPNAYQSNQSGTTYVVRIVSGTGANQFRTIYSNTSTALNLYPSWRTNPDATSQYEIYTIFGNPHYVNADPGALSDVPVTGGTTTTLTANASLIGIDAWVDYSCDFIAGTGAGQSAVVASNTTSVLTFASPVATPADNTTRFNLRRVLKMARPIYEYTGCSGDGDFWLHLDRRNDFLMEGALGLPNLGDDNSGALVTLFYAASQAAVPLSARVRKCTYFTGQQSLSLIEGWVSGMLSQRLDELKSCFAWSYGGLTYPTANTGPYLCSDVPASGNPGANPLDMALAPGGADYNGTFGLNPGYAGKGYNTNTSDAGAHDLPFNTDPQFFAPERDFAAWSAMMGAPSSDPRAQVTYGLALLKASPGLIPSSLVPWVREGARPQNEALRFAGHDGAQVGAIAMAWAFTGAGAAGAPAGSGSLGFAWAFSGAGPSGAPAALGALGFAWAIAGAGASGAPAGAGALGYGWSVAGAGVAGGASGSGEFDWLPPPWEISGAGIAGAPVGSGEVFDATPAGGVLPAFLLDQLAVIESRGAAVDANGAPIPDWSLVSGAARCRLTEMSARDQVLQERDGRLGTHWVDFNGDWSAIVPADGRIRVAGRAFLVTGVNAVRGAGYVAYTQVACREVAG